MPGTKKSEKITTANGSDLRQLEIQHNNLVKDIEAMQRALTGDYLLGWYGVGPNTAAAPLAIASTDTQVGTAAMVFTVGGVPVVKAVSNAGTTFGALGTIPASTWGVIAIDVVAAGTVTYLSGAANYTTGYATEAAAIAALPARVTVKARVGYLTILASASTWVAATDALAGGSSGNPATTTNYYPEVGVCGPTGTALGPNGVVTAYVPPTGSAWTAGRNGVLIATVMAIGSTDTRFATTAFTYNANGLTNIAKAAVTAGTAFGALGTIPVNKWGLIVGLINGAGTITFMSAPANYTTGYDTEDAAKGDLNKIFPAAGLCMFGYCTIKTEVGSTFVVQTDALAGGASGNPASATNYYPTPGITVASGESASLLANREGTVLSSVNY
jgi:hypothetical protein